jgi:hypothetical protein
MEALEVYLRACTQARQFGVQETSYYAALKDLCDSAGAELKPKVVYIINPKGHERSLPDGALVPANHLPKPGQEGLPFEEDSKRKPERGVVEVKGLTENLEELLASEQIARYLRTYGQVLATNLRQFAVLQLREGKAVEVERLDLAKSVAEFWQLAERPKDAARTLGKPLEEFLGRALRATTTLASPADVAAHFASYAREARYALDLHDNILELTALQETVEGALGVQFAGEAGDDFFRSTLVQTLFYGVFSAWVLWHEHDPLRKDAFRWQETHIWLSLPVIEGLFRGATSKRVLDQSGLVHTLENAEHLLNRVERTAFFEAFEKGLAVQYFYEPFLAAFDPELRKQLGVWYTPPEIVRYMVARVDQVLQEELGEADGLASPNVLVLDPCCGTGAYLVECLRLIAKRYEDRGEGVLHGDDLRKAVTERLYGFELLPGPFVVSHLQIGFLMAKLGIGLAAYERAGVFLTNALTGWDPTEDVKRPLDPIGLFAESDHAKEVKRDKPILVVIGNPPYNGYAGISKMDEERDLVTRYVDGRRRGQGLNDLYVRFFAMADRRIEATGRGVICFISNYSWLDGLSFGEMRRRYLSIFDRIWIDNLNGDKYATGKTTPEGLPDPSVFSTEFNREGIQVGTAVTTLVRQRKLPIDRPVARLFYREFWGMRKRAELEERKASDEGYQYINPAPGLGYPFKPRDFSKGYLDWPLLTSLFINVYSGITTSRDGLVTDIDRPRLERRMMDYLGNDVSDDAMTRLEPTSVRTGFERKDRDVRRRLAASGYSPMKIIRWAYRPFDVRWLYWDAEPGFMDRPRPEYVKHLSVENCAFVATPRDRKGFTPPQCITAAASYNLIERASNVFLLRLAPQQAANSDQLPLLDEPVTSSTERATWNLSQVAWDALEAANLSEEPQSLFFHTVAILHSPEYASENAGALRQDWPRVPVPHKAEILRRGAELGRLVASVLNPESPVPGVTTGDIPSHLQTIARFEWDGKSNPSESTEDLALKGNWGYRNPAGAVMPGGGNTLRADGPVAQPKMLSGEANNGKPGVASGTVTAVLNSQGRWTGIPEEVWNYTLGGYQVLKKWLSYREREVLGRPMKLAEVREFSYIARRIAAVLALGPELDRHYRESAEAAASPQA